MHNQPDAMELVVVPMTERDKPAWLAMRHALWPDATVSEHADEVRVLMARPEFAAFVARHGRSAIGFAEVYVRPFANGCDSRPVPFLEGIWVAPEARGRGVGSALLGAIEDWSRRQGYVELGSDALIENKDSHSVHAAWGFAETERVVYFRKALRTESR